MILTKISNVFLRGYSPYYYIRKYTEMFPNFFKDVEKKLYVRNEIQAIKKIGYATLKSKNVILNKVFDRCVLIAKGHQIKFNKNGKSFWNIICKNEDLMKFDEIKSYILSDYFKDIAQSYLNSKPVLASADLIISFPTQIPITHSQLWHLDADDTKICTFYLYCSDVDEGSGPFKLAPKNLSNKKFLPKWLRKYGYSDNYFHNFFCKKENIKVLTGNSKFEFVCDTANTYHCGSACSSNTRLVLAFRYVSECPLYELSDWSKKTKENNKNQ